MGSPPQSGAHPPADGGHSTVFDRWAAFYDASALQHALFQPVHRAALAQTQRRAPAPRAILDVGCGSGLLLDRAALTYPRARLVGVDPCAAMLAQAVSGRTGPGTTPAGASFVRARAEQLPFRTGAFDLVFSTLSLRHWEQPERGLAELGRVTAPGGVLVIADVFDRTARLRRSHHVWRSSAWMPIRALTRAGVRPCWIQPVHVPLAMATVGLLVAGKPPTR